MRRFKAKLILILMIVSLFGVGFAAWNIIVPTDPGYVEGEVETEDVILLQALSNPRFDTQLRYNKNGFFTQYIFDPETDKISSKVYDNITYTIDIDYTECRKLSTDTKSPKSFDLVITLKDYTNYIEIDKILSLVVSDKNNIITGNVSIVSKQFEIKSNEINVYLTFTVPEDLAKTKDSISVKYDFKNVVTDGSNATIKGFFETLSNVDKDKAFIVSASLYANYE